MPENPKQDYILPIIENFIDGYAQQVGYEIRDIVQWYNLHIIEMQDNRDIFSERDEKIMERIHQFWVHVLPLYEYRDEF